MVESIQDGVMNRYLSFPNMNFIVKIVHYFSFPTLLFEEKKKISHKNVECCLRSHIKFECILLNQNPFT